MQGLKCSTSPTPVYAGPQDKKPDLFLLVDSSELPQNLDPNISNVADNVIVEFSALDKLKKANEDYDHSQSCIAHHLWKCAGYNTVPVEVINTYLQYLTTDPENPFKKALNGITRIEDLPTDQRIVLEKAKKNFLQLSCKTVFEAIKNHPTLTAEDKYRLFKDWVDCQNDLLFQLKEPNTIWKDLIKELNQRHNLLSFNQASYYEGSEETYSLPLRHS
jgi:hypothetical protein